jgi:hypothetical protein
MPAIHFIAAFSWKMLYKCSVEASYSSKTGALYNSLKRFKRLARRPPPGDRQDFAVRKNG